MHWPRSVGAICQLLILLTLLLDSGLGALLRWVLQISSLIHPLLAPVKWLLLQGWMEVLRGNEHPAPKHPCSTPQVCWNLDTSGLTDGDIKHEETRAAELHTVDVLPPWHFLAQSWDVTGAQGLMARDGRAGGHCCCCWGVILFILLFGSQWKITLCVQFVEPWCKEMLGKSHTPVHPRKKEKRGRCESAWGVFSVSLFCWFHKSCAH